MARHAGMVTKNEPRRCTSRTGSSSAGVMLWNALSRRIPALLTTMSTRPNASSAASTMAPPPSRVDTVSVLGTATPPASSISRATVAAGPADAPSPSTAPPRSLTTTCAPRAASSRAWARPRPLPAPVTTAARPSNPSSATPAPLRQRRLQPGRPIPDHLGLSQAVELVGGQAQLAAQDLVVVLAQRRRRPPAPAVDACQPGERQPGVVDGPGMRMIQGLEEAPGAQLDVADDRRGQYHRGRRDAGRGELLDHLVPRPGGEPRPQLPVEEVVGRPATPVRGQRRIGRPRRVAQHQAQGGPLVVVGDGERHPLLLAGTGVDVLRRRRPSPVAVPLEHDAVHVVLDHLLGS